MRIDGSTGPKLISADLYERQKVGCPPKWTARNFIAGRLYKPNQDPRPSLGVIGPLEISLARNKEDIKRVQKLRYEVFYKHGAAVADVLSRLTRRDQDDFDSICDHLMVVDQSGLQSLSGEYRSRRAIELLWHGVWRYVREHRVDVMIGCASFEGTNSELLARPLSLLHHFALAPEPWRASARPSRRVEMNMMGRSEIEIRCAWRELPPLIKGYLRAGAYVGDGAVIDPRFGTIDVLIVLPVAAINPRYIRYFGADAQRCAAG